VAVCLGCCGFGWEEGAWWRGGRVGVGGVGVGGRCLVGTGGWGGCVFGGGAGPSGVGQVGGVGGGGGGGGGARGRGGGLGGSVWLCEGCEGRVVAEHGGVFLVGLVLEKGGGWLVVLWGGVAGGGAGGVWVVLAVGMGQGGGGWPPPLALPLHDLPVPARPTFPPLCHNLHGRTEGVRRVRNFKRGKVEPVMCLNYLEGKLK